MTKEFLPLLVNINCIQHPTYIICFKYLCSHPWRSVLLILDFIGDKVDLERKGSYLKLHVQYAVDAEFEPPQSGSPGLADKPWCGSSPSHRE